MSVFTDPPEWVKDVKIQRLRGDDVTRIMGLFAAHAELRKACEDERMRERFRCIPNGYRDLRMVTKALSRLVEGLKYTVPIEKRDGFDRTVGRAKFNVMLGPLAHKPSENYEETLTTKELDTLTAFAWEGSCKICVECDCDRCELGKVLDNVVAQDRAGGCWGTMDIRRKDI